MSYVSHLWNLVCAIVAVVVFAACDSSAAGIEATATIVRVTSSKELIGAIDSLRIGMAFRDSGEWRVAATRNVASDALSWPCDLRIRPGSQARVDDLFSLEITALDVTGAVVAQGHAVTGFVPGESRLLEFVLSSCGGAVGGLCSDNV